MNIKDFLYRNKLKQVDLANYLGISEAAVSRLCKEYSNPSEDNLAKLLSNPNGWDTSMLTADVTEADEPATSADIKALQREITLLREQLKAERERCDKYIAIIERWCH